MPITVGTTTQAYQFQESGSNVDFVTELTVGNNPHVVISTTVDQNDNQMPYDAFTRWIAGTGIKGGVSGLTYDVASLTEETTPAGTDVFVLERSGAARKVTHANLIASVSQADLATTTTVNDVTVTNTVGTDATIAAVSGTQAGVVTTTQFNAWEAARTVNLDETITTTQITIDGQTGGTNAVLPSAVGGGSPAAGLMVGSQVDQLDGTTTGWVDTAFIADDAITLAKLGLTAQTNLSSIPQALSVLLGSSTGSGTTLAPVNATDAGVSIPEIYNKVVGATVNNWVTTAMIAALAVDTTEIADGAVTLAKLDTSAQTTISVGVTATTADISSSTGGGDSVPAATQSAAGVMTAADKTAHDNLVASYQNNAAVTGAFAIDASVATLIRLNLTGTATPTITLPSQPQRLVFMIELNGFTFNWTNMSLHASVLDPLLVDGRPNFVHLDTDGTNLFSPTGS